MEISGHIAFVTTQSPGGGLLAIDIQDVSNPLVLGNYVESTWPKCLALAGAFVLLGDDSSGLHVVDVSDPANMSRVGLMANYGPIESIAISGQYAYLATPWTGFSVVDISDPANPVKVAELPTPVNIRDIEVGGGFAFVADHTAGVQIIDISDPLHPRVASELGVSSSISRVRLAGNLLFVVSSSAVHIVNISDPLHPEIIGAIDSIQNPADVEIGAGRAYIANWAVLSIFDITVPEHPKAVGNAELGGYSPWMSRISGARVAVVDSGGISFGNLAQAGINVGGRLDISGDARAISFADRRLYVAEWPGVLRILDVSNPQQPKRIGQIPATGSGFVIRNGRAFVGETPNGLAIFDVTEPSQPRKLGSSRSGDEFVSNFGIVLRDSAAYMAMGSIGIDVIDVGDEVSPNRVARVSTGGSAAGLVISGNHLVVADGNSGLAIFDLANSFHPQLVRRVPVTGGAWFVQAEDSRLYVQAAQWGIEIFDARDINNVVRLGGEPVAYPGNGYSVSGDYLFIGFWGYAPQLYDVATPASPALVAEGNRAFTTVSAALHGHLAFAGTFGSGVRIMEIDLPGADPQAVSFEVVTERTLAEGAFQISASVSSGLPVSFSIVSGPGSLAGTTVTPTGLGEIIIEARQAGDARFQPATQSRKVRIVSKLSQNIAFAPISAQRLNSGPVPLIARSDRDLPVSFQVISGPATAAGNALTLLDRGLVVVRAKNSGTAEVQPAFQDQTFEVLRPLPVHVGLSPLGAWPGIPQGAAYDVKVAGPVAYVAAGWGGLVILDVSDPHLPRLLGHHPAEGLALGVAVSGNTAFLACGPAGLQIVDVSDPARPVGLSRFVRNDGWPMDVAIDGRIAYVADQARGLSMVDISNPSRPFLLSSQSTVGTPVAVTVSEGVAYVAMHTEGVELVDVSDPGNPRKLSRFPLPRHAFDLTVAGSTAYVASGDDGLRILDVADPQNPRLLGIWFTRGNCKDVTISGHLAFIADQHEGLKVVDVSNPAAPRTVGEAPTTAYAWKVAQAGDRLYVADHNGGMIVFDVSAPGSPVRLGTYSTNHEVTKSIMDGPRVYLACGGAGVVFLDVSDPANPRKIGAYDTPGFAKGIALNGDRLLVADGGNGFHVLDVSDPAASRRLGGYKASLRWPLDIGVHGNTAVVFDNYAGLLTYDISDLQNIREIGGIRNPFGDKIVVFDHYALVTSWSGGGITINISDPANLVLASSIRVSANPGNVGAIGGVGVVVDPTASFALPIEWAVRGRMEDMALDIGISGTTAFLPHRDKGIEIVDFSDVDDLQPVGSYRTAGASILARGDIVYASGGTTGFQTLKVLSGEKSRQSIHFHRIYDQTLADGPVRISASVDSKLPLTFRIVSGEGEVSTPVKAWWNDAVWEAKLTPEAGGTVVVRAEQSGNDDYAPGFSEQSFEVFDPQPQTIAFTPVAGLVLSSGPVSLQASASSGLPVSFRVVSGPGQVAGNSLAFLGTGEVVVRAEQAGNDEWLPAFVERTIRVIDPQAQTIDFAPIADRAFEDGPVTLSATASSGLPVSFRVSAGLARVAGTVLTPMGYGPVTVRAEQPGRPGLWSAYAERTFTILGEDPESLEVREAAHWPGVEGGTMRGLVVAKGHAFLAGYRAGLQVVQLEEAGGELSLAHVASLDTPGLAVGVAVAGDYAYVADWEAGLRVIDISAPAGPREVGAVVTPAFARGVAVAGSYAYVADWVGGVQVIDVSNRASPKAVGHFATMGWASAVTVAGSRAYIAEGNGGLGILNLSNPAAPSRLGRIETGGWAYGISVDGTRAGLADGPTGLGLVDAEDGEFPRVVGRYNSGDFAHGVVLRAGMAYLLDGQGLKLVQISDPEFPRVLGRYEAEGFAYGVVVDERADGARVYLAEGPAGLRVLHVRRKFPAAP